MSRKTLADWATNHLAADDRENSRITAHVIFDGD
jgi:hypothetical protein